jgi:hypothetical protein
MIQSNHRSLRGIIPLSRLTTRNAFLSTFQALMTSILPSLMTHCPLVTHIDPITPHNDRSRLRQFRQLKDVLIKHNNHGLSNLESITFHEYSDTDWTDEEVCCLLQPPSNGTTNWLEVATNLASTPTNSSVVW